MLRGKVIDTLRESMKEEEKDPPEDDDGAGTAPGIWEEGDYTDIPVLEDDDDPLLLNSLISFLSFLAVVCVLPLSGKFSALCALGLFLLGVGVLIFVKGTREIPIAVTVPTATGLLGALFGGLLEQYAKRVLPPLPWL